MLTELKWMKGDKERLLETQVQALIDEGHERYLDLGVGGRLLIEGDQVEVLPLEDEKALNEAKPKLVDGKFTFDAEKVRVREEAMVKNAFSRGPVAVVILGGGHDLSSRLGSECRYVRVTVKGYRD